MNNPFSPELIESKNPQFLLVSFTSSVKFSKDFDSITNQLHLPISLYVNHISWFSFKFQEVKDWAEPTSKLNSMGLPVLSVKDPNKIPM